MPIEDRAPGEPTSLRLIAATSAEDLYDKRPAVTCRRRWTAPSSKINTTLLDWTGYDRAELVGRRRFTDS